MQNTTNEEHSVEKGAVRLHNKATLQVVTS